MRIDSHHHLWRYDPGEYPWIDENKSVLRRDYLPADLKAEIDRSGIEGTIVVQARQTFAETRWLLDLARQHSFLQGVVGWVPLVDADIDTVLAEFTGDTKLRGVRHVLQDEPDDAFMLREDFNRGVGRLGTFGLVYDILIYARHLANAIWFVDMHPQQPFVLDHIAKPAITRTTFDRRWADQIRELARRDHVSCKLSGVLTEVRDPEWNSELIRPYFETVLEAFGPDRLMFGTDWPVCLLRSGYGEWVTAVGELIGGLSITEQARIMGLNSRRIYGLNPA